MTIQIKAAERYFQVVLFIMLYEIDVLNLRSESVKSYSVTIQIKATAQGVLTASFGGFLKCINFFAKIELRKSV